MNVGTLIDAMVRQTTILLAQLATASGGRAPLAHTPNQVFLDLVAALREQGLGSKIIADMFGLALRTYQEKVRRLSESRTVRGRSLWEAVLETVEQRGPVLRAELLARFAHDDSASVRGVLRDLVKSGLLYRTGKGAGTTYRAADPDELRTSAAAPDAAMANLVWVGVQRLRPASVEEVMQFLSQSRPAVLASLTELEQQGLVTVMEDGRYDTPGCVLSYEDPKGWEAAVYDHFQAMVTALGIKLRQGRTAARVDDAVGGSTFGFEVWPGHPHLDEVMGFLRQVRGQGSALRAKVAKYNEAHDPDPGAALKVIAYVGQAVIRGEEADALGSSNGDTE